MIVGRDRRWPGPQIACEMRELRSPSETPSPQQPPRPLSADQVTEESPCRSISSFQRVVIALLDARRRERDTAVIFVTHEINPILPVVDRVLYLAAGSWAIGTPDDVLTSETMSRLYQTSVDVIHLRGRIIVVGTPERARRPVVRRRSGQQPQGPDQLYRATSCRRSRTRRSRSPRSRSPRGSERRAMSGRCVRSTRTCPNTRRPWWGEVLGSPAS